MRVGGWQHCQIKKEGKRERKIAMKVEGGWVETLSDGVAIWEFM